MAENNVVETTINYAERATAPKKVPSEPSYVIVPDGHSVEYLDAEKYLPAPKRKRAHVTVQDATSFVEYFNWFSDEGSVIFADAAQQSFKAVLDYHLVGEGPARWGDQVLSYAPPKTKEWQTWMAANNKVMAQVAFAQFIEDNLADVADPPGATLLEMARTLEAKKNVKFSSGIRLDNGQQQISYEEEIRGTANKGSLEIPETFTLGLAPFYEGSKYKLVARLRWRINDGHAEFWYRLNQPEKVIESAFNDTIDSIQKGTRGKLIRGTP